MKLTYTLMAMIFSLGLRAQEQIVVTQNIQYDEHKSCVLDVAQPVSDSKELRPAIVIVHGGGWSAGDKRDAVYTNLAPNFIQTNPAYSEWTIQSNGLGLCHELRIKQKNGKSIYGVISNPSKPGKHGVAIISHGFNGTHHFGKDYFRTLNDLGYAVYTFDFPCGSVNSQSDNNTMEMSVTDEKQALKEIVAYFQKQKDIDKNQIVLIGESQGGLVSALAAAELKKQVSNLILIYPALCIPDNWNARYPTVESIPEVSEIWGVKLGKKFMMDVRPLKPFDIIGNYKGRVLIVHGTDDKVVPIDYSRRAVETYDNADLKIIDRAGHGFNPMERTLSNRYVREFLEQK